MSDRLSPTRMLRWLLPLGIVLLALVAFAVVQAERYSSAATGGGSDGKGATTSIGFFTPKHTRPVAFSLPVLSAESSPHDVSMSAFSGRPLVINMWSSTCTVCTSETPAIESVARRLSARVSFVGIDTADEHGPALSFLKRYHVTYEQLFDPDDHVGTGYGIPGLPVTIFVNRSGKVVGENLGALTTRTLSTYLQRLFGVRY